MSAHKVQKPGNHQKERIQLTKKFLLEPDSECTLLMMTDTVQPFRAALRCLHAVRTFQAF
jgi:hypothetical protein